MNAARPLAPFLRAAVLAVCVAWPGAAPALETLRLVVTHPAPPLVPNSVMDLADTLGFYEREGLKVEFVRVQHTPLAITAIKTGFGDLANVSLGGALQFAAQSETRIKAILSPGKSIPFLIAAHARIAAPKDLAGATLGIGGVGSLDHTLTRQVLAALKVDVDKIKVVSLGDPQLRAQALVAGRIDATTMSVGVWNRIRARPDLKVLVSVDDYFAAAPVLNKVIIADAGKLAAKRDAIARFVRAIMLASRQFAREPKAWVDAMLAARPELKRDELEELARSFAASWAVNGGLDAAQMTYSIDQQYREAELKGMRRVSLAEFWDTGPVDATLRAIGIAPGLDAPGR